MGTSEAVLGQYWGPLGPSWSVGSPKRRESQKPSKTIEKNICFSLLGPSWGASWRVFCRVLEASTPLGTILGAFERTVGERGPLWRPLGAENSNFSSGSRVWASSWSRRGAVLGASWVPLGPSWGFLGPSWGRLGGLLGRLGAVLGASWAVLERREAEKAVTVKTLRI